MRVVRHDNGYEIHCTDTEFEILLGMDQVSQDEGICRPPGGFAERHEEALTAREAGGAFLRVDEDMRSQAYG